MAKPIEIPFTSDTSEVIKGAGNIADAFDDVSDALRDLARDGERSGDDLADSLDGAKDSAEDLAREGGRSGEDLADSLDGAKDSAKDLGDAAEDAGEAVKDGGRTGEKGLDGLQASLKDTMDDADKLGREGKDALDKLADSGRKAGKETGDSLEAGFSKAGEGMDEFKDEANGTAKEAAASFDGSAESIGDVFQELAANAFSGFGPAGQIAGLAAAIGLGVALSKLQEVAEANTEAKEKAAELGRELYATGGQMEAGDLAGKIADIAFALGQEDVWYKWGDQAATNVGIVKAAMEDLEDAAAQDAFKGLAGDLEAAARAQDELEAATRRDTAALEDHVVVLSDGVTAYDAEGRKIEEGIKAREELAERIEDETGVRRGASEEVDYYTDVMGRSTEEVEAQNEALMENVENLQAQADMHMAADEAADNYAATLDDATAKIKENGKTTDANTEKGRENRAAVRDLADAANSHIDALIQQGSSTANVTTKTQAARESFVKAAEAAGYTREEARKLADRYGLIPKNVDTRVQAHNVQETKNSLDGLEDPRTATVNAKLGDTSQVSGWLSGLSQKYVWINVKPRQGVPFRP